MEENYRTYLRAGIAAIWRQLQPYRRELWILGALGVISAIANGSVPYVSGRFFDALIAVSQKTSGSGMSSLPLWAALLGVWVIIQLLANNADWIIDRIERKIHTQIQLGIQASGFIHLLYVPISHHKSSHIHGEYQKFSAASWRVASIIGHLTRLIPQVLSVFIGITLAMSINVPLASILILGVMVYTLLLLRVLPEAVQNDKELYKLWNENWDTAAAHVQQIESIKQAAAETHEKTFIVREFRDTVARYFYREQLHWSNVGFSQRITVFITQAAILTLSVHYVASGALSVGQLIALNAYAMLFFGPFVQLGHAWQTIQNGIVSAAKAEEVFSVPHEVYEPKDAVSLGRMEGHITFEHVSFQYEDNHPAVLQNVTFDIKPGMRVALVGESGGGKSTTISFISGYYFPTEGSVRIDGINTRQLGLTELRSQVAIVPQEIALFHDTIKNNIRYGSFGADDVAIESAARAVQLHEFITQQPKGYETLVGERGIKLSVGQKQRVAIARAMLRNPAILILDEPTSALDASTERIVTENLESLMEGRTTVIIAHRLSTVRKADLILVFDKGSIVERGTHEELLQVQNGTYRRLHDYQIGLH